MVTIIYQLNCSFSTRQPTHPSSQTYLLQSLLLLSSQRLFLPSRSLTSSTHTQETSIQGWHLVANEKGNNIWLARDVSHAKTLDKYGERTSAQWTLQTQHGKRSCLSGSEHTSSVLCAQPTVPNFGDEMIMGWSLAWIKRTGGAPVQSFLLTEIQAVLLPVQNAEHYSCPARIVRRDLWLSNNKS